MQTASFMILGTTSSGKTQFIQTISEIDVVSFYPKIREGEIIKEQSKVAIDIGRLTLGDDIVLYLLSQPGVRYVDYVFQLFSQMVLPNFLGFVFIVRSDDHLTYELAKVEFQKVLAIQKPVLVIANFQDKATSASPSQLRQILAIPHEIPILPCIAKDEAHVRRIIIEFLKRLPISELTQHLLDKLTTQEALDLDLSKYNQKTKVFWGNFVLFRSGQEHFVKLIENIKGYIAQTSKFIDHVEYRRYEFADGILDIYDYIALYFQGGFVQDFQAVFEKTQNDWRYPPHYRADLQGYLFLVDSTKPEFLPDLKHALQLYPTLTTHPYVIIMDRQEQPNAISPETLRKEVETTEVVPILTCEIIDAEVMKKAVLTLHNLNPSDEKLAWLAQGLSLGRK